MREVAAETQNAVMLHAARKAVYPSPPPVPNAGLLSADLRGHGEKEAGRVFLRTDNLTAEAAVI